MFNYSHLLNINKNINIYKGHERGCLVIFCDIMKNQQLHCEFTVA